MSLVFNFLVYKMEAIIRIKYNSYKIIKGICELVGWVMMLVAKS